jgi:hypothetical protein
MACASAATKVSLAVFRISMVLFAGVVPRGSIHSAWQTSEITNQTWQFHFEDIAQQVGLCALNVYRNDPHKAPGTGPGVGAA